MNKALFVILLLSISTLCIGFSPNTTTCTFYYPEDTHKDANIQSLLLVINKSKAVKICGEDSSEGAVYTASKINKVEGFSYYRLSRIFKTKGELGVQWSSSPPKDKSDLYSREIYISTRVGDITHSDENFILAIGLSIGVLSYFLNEWSELTGSESKYDEATELLKNNNRQFIASNELKGYLFKNWFQSPPKITTVRYVLGGWDLPPHYAFSLVMEKKVWSIGFDFMGDKIKVLRMSLNHI